MEPTTPDGAAAYRHIDAAFGVGDIAALEAEIGHLDGFPNVEAHRAMGLCLVYAVYHSPMSLIRELLDRGADPNRSDGDGYPPLIAAVSCAVPAAGATERSDVCELIELMLSYGADIEQRGINDYSPLHLAASTGDLNIIDLLLSHGADPNAITHIDNYETPAEVAAVGGHNEAVTRLRPLTSRLDWENAVRDGDIDVLRRMVRNGHDINKRDGFGMTGLMRCAHSGRGDTVEWLISQGADLDHTSKFNLSALMLAVIAEHQNIARLLVRAGADATITGTGAPGFHGKTAADLAEDRGDTRLGAFIRRGTT